MLPLFVGLGLISALGVARAAWRAKVRLDKLPASYFGVIDAFHPDKKAPFLPGGFASNISYHEALQILQLPSNPTMAQLTTQHRKIMIANHPDRGGSTYMALKVNEARDVIQKHIKR